MVEELIELVMVMVGEEGYNLLTVNLDATDQEEVFHFSHLDEPGYVIHFLLRDDYKIMKHTRKDFFLERVKKVLKEY